MFQWKVLLICMVYLYILKIINNFIMARKKQIINGIRKRKIRKSKTMALDKNPQLRGICLAIRIVSPKKPNSALRKVARVRLSTNREVTVVIPGEGHSLNKHSVVLIRGGRCRDVPGLRYKIIRGVLDCKGVVTRKTKRSKYGCKKNEF